MAIFGMIDISGKFGMMVKNICRRNIMKTAQLIRITGAVDWDKLPRIEIDAPIKESDSPATAYAQICAT